jgi:sulfite exporter TauE/SafE
VDGWLVMLAAAAFASAFMGGAHCAVMCGGMISMAGGGARRYARIIHAARIASYAAAGSVAGALSHAGLALGESALARQALLLAGALTLCVTALHVLGIGAVTQRLETAGAVVWKAVAPVARLALPVNGAARAAVFGALWGWLPCGMAYAALLLAASAGSARNGAAVMIAFGLGTLPALWLAHAGWSRWRAHARSRVMRWCMGLALALAAGWVFVLALHPAHVPPAWLFCAV